jgi:hypothetical protein
MKLLEAISGPLEFTCIAEKEHNLFAWVRKRFSETIFTEFSLEIGHPRKLSLLQKAVGFCSQE